MKITIPELSLVVLIGPSGSGKSTFAHKFFKPTEVLSSDFFRGLVSDDENSQAATKDAFEVLHYIAAKRLAAGKLTVIDATNVQPEARKPLIALAREYHCMVVAIVLNIPEKLCLDRNRQRPDRKFGPHVVRQQSMQMRRSLRDLQREGFRYTFVLSSAEQVENVEVERQALWSNLRHLSGPFDIIGDVHGCFDELHELLIRLGYEINPAGEKDFEVSHPEGRTAIFLGDLGDRGPDTPGVLHLVMDMVDAGVAYCVPGNHDVKLLRKLKGRDVRISNGLAMSLEQLEGESPAFIDRLIIFLDSLVSHYVLDEGRLVVAHAGMKETLQGRGSRQVRDFALYGEATGETDEAGFPIRYNWASEYRGSAMVVYGHTTIAEPEWLNRTVNIDTGCVFGGKLTALRYPEKEFLSVPAAHVYWESPKKAFLLSEQPAQPPRDDVLDLEDVVGKRLITTRLLPGVTIREENATAALEVMSRFAVHPGWLIYLPPTMSPSETSHEPGLLEHPAEAFAYYQQEGIPTVVCEEKHMGSRVVVIVCRDEDVVRKRFGIINEGAGICYTRTGRRFFNDPQMEQALLAGVRKSLDETGFWEEFKTDWVCLDCELMPWSVKAQSLLQEQYAAVGVAAQTSLKASVEALEQASRRDLPLHNMLATYKERQKLTDCYVEAYRRYCWPVRSVEDLKLAPFHLLATEGEVYSDKNHLWHMQMLARLCQVEGSHLLATPYKVVELADPVSQAEGIRWWQELTDRGGEGMVTKPLEFVVRGKHGLVQPALKSRGPEYLRIIYGPEYSRPDNLDRLRVRGLGAKKSLALREFALGIESLERFVQHEPLRRVHECTFGVLALESEPVDPRL